MKVKLERIQEQVNTTENTWRELESRKTGSVKRAQEPAWGDSRWPKDYVSFNNDNNCNGLKVT